MGYILRQQKINSVRMLAANRSAKVNFMIEKGYFWQPETPKK